jgi:hypothetical protein
MDTFAVDDLKMLTEEMNGPCVSILMPTQRTNAEQNRIRFKNLYRKAENMLAAMETGDVEVEKGMESAGGLLENHDFWQHQSDGFALFCADDSFQTYRLPIAFEELAVVTDHFHIKPLVPLVTSDARFYILAASQSRVRLFHCTRQAIREMELEAMPKNLSEALKYDDHEKQLQFHTGAGGTGGRRPAVFHGHGVGTDDAKDRILRYFREIDRSLSDVMRDEKSPLVLAGVDYLLPIYREANSYPHLLVEGISGNPDEMEEKDLRDKAWDLIEPLVKEAQADAARRYHDLVGTGKTSRDLENIIVAAGDGRVELLFLAEDAQQWGRFDSEKGGMEVHRAQKPGDADLLNLAAVETLRKGGGVYVLAQGKVPDDAVAAALLRY